MKLFVCGGHVTPALAVIEEIQARFPNWEIVFVGRMHAMEGEREPSVEYQLMHDGKIRFLPLEAGRWPRSFTKYTLPAFLKIFTGFVQALAYIRNERPDVIISFGGYVAVPIVLSAWFFGIPTVTHEQTRTPGLANRFISFFVKRIFVSFSDMTSLFPKDKTVYTGLPLRKSLFRFSEKSPIPFSRSYPLLYIAGGATGSVSINSLVASILPDLVKKYTVIHQIGERNTPSYQHPRYHVFPYINVSDLSWIYQHMSLYIGRSGANTVGELAALGKVALFIPLPWAGGNEQYKNAQPLKEAGTAVIFNQKNGTSHELLANVEEMFTHMQTYVRHAQAHAKTIPHDASTRMVSEIHGLLS